MNQTIPDQECNTIIMVWPSIYKKKKYWIEILEIYCKIIDLLLECNNYIFIIKNKDDNVFKDISRLNNTLDISKINLKKYKNLIKLIDYETNDIWIRDYGPQIALNKENNQYFFYNYYYNAYGEKYPFDKDNNFSNHYVKNFYKIHKNKEIIMKEPLKNIILEGGNIINNGLGLSLFNKKCMELNNNKSWVGIEKELKLNYASTLSLLDGLKSTSLIMDVVYQPERTFLLNMASMFGYKVLSGKRMNLLQAAYGFEKAFADQRISLNKISNIMEKV